MYEFTLICGSRTPVGSTRISGVSVVDDLSGMSGPTVILSVNHPLPSTVNFVCLYNLDTIDDRMQEKFDSCDTNGNKQIALSWRDEEPLHSGLQ